MDEFTQSNVHQFCHRNSEHILGMTADLTGKTIGWKLSLVMVFESAPPTHLKKEREKARKLRHTTWWKNKLARGVCYLCHQKFEKTQLTMEHLIPLARGGYSIKNNIEVACKKCNSKKQHQTIVETRLKYIKPSSLKKNT